MSKAPKPDNLSSDAKPCWSCENYGCRKNCFEDSEIQNCKNTNSTDIFDMPLLLTYFVFAQQKRLQSSVTQKWEIWLLRLITLLTLENFWRNRFLVHQLKRRLNKVNKKVIIGNGGVFPKFISRFYAQESGMLSGPTMSSEMTNV